MQVDPSKYIPPVYETTHSTAHTGMTNQMTKAIKDYKDEYFTGLTDDERQAINDEIKAYLEKHSDKKKVDPNELKNLISHLLLQYGYKGNLNDGISSFYQLYADSDGTLKTPETASKGLPDVSHIAYAISGQSVLATKEQLLGTDPEPSAKQIDTVVSLESLQNKKEEASDEVTTKTIENPDGTKTVLMIRHQRIINQIKIGSPTTHTDPEKTTPTLF